MEGIKKLQPQSSHSFITNNNYNKEKKEKKVFLVLQKLMRYIDNNPGWTIILVIFFAGFLEFGAAFIAIIWIIISAIF